MSQEKDVLSKTLPRPRARVDIQPVLNELRAALRTLYGERLAKLILYGSFARGDATEASDIDVLVVLRGTVRPWTEIKRMAEVTYPIALKHEELIAELPISLSAYESQARAFLTSVYHEGVAL